MVQAVVHYLEGGLWALLAGRASLAASPLSSALTGRDLVDMVDIISINSRRTLYPLSGADNAALGPFYLVFLLYKNFLNKAI
jgi:hypothetical protein